MFVIEANEANAAKKMAILMAVVILLTGSAIGLYLIFTLHFYVKPSLPMPRSFRIFGFPRP
jgi:hypothetical protein